MAEIMWMLIKYLAQKNDHDILNAALRLKSENPTEKVILVSKRYQSSP